MRGWIASGLVLVAWSGTSSGQVVDRERDVTITGPRGRTIERQVRSERGPGFADREIRVQRPGATLDRHVRVDRSRAPGFMNYGGYGPPPRAFVERDVVIERGPGWGPSFGFGLPFFSFAFGSPALPPPVVVAPPPIYIAPPVAPQVIYNPPVRYGAPLPPATVVADPVADAVGRLRSTHDHSRRDGALTLGRLGDARAVTPLIDRLQHDGASEVRVASAWALAEIGHPASAVPLQRAALFDKRREVREAAAEAYRRIPIEGQSPTAAPAGSPPGGVDESADPVPVRANDIPPPPPEPAPQPSRSNMSFRPTEGFSDAP